MSSASDSSDLDPSSSFFQQENDENAQLIFSQPSQPSLEDPTAKDSLTTSILHSPPSLYQPPPLKSLFDNPQDAQSSDDEEAPASVRFELQPLNEASRQPGWDPRNRFPSGFSQPESLESGSHSRYTRRPPVRLRGLSGLASHLHLRPPMVNSPTGLGPLKITAWTDVSDLDQFLALLYQYYTGKGFFCILLSQITNLLHVFLQ